MKFRLLLATSLLLLSTAAKAQTTTYNNVDTPSVNAGDHSWATFYFGHWPNGEPGSTALIIQCAFNRAELITGFDVYGLQASSRFFAVTCSHTPLTFINNEPTVTYTLNGTPLSESLVMYGYGGSVQNLNLLVDSATWTVSGYTGHGSRPTVTGESQIAY